MGGYIKDNITTTRKRSNHCQFYRFIGERCGIITVIASVLTLFGVVGK